VVVCVSFCVLCGGGGGGGGGGVRLAGVHLLASDCCFGWCEGRLLEEAAVEAACAWESCISQLRW
jgi:hypothetical protein